MKIKLSWNGFLREIHRIKDQARKLGIEDRIRFVRYVPREEINAYYNSAHVFALPSYNEE